MAAAALMTGAAAALQRQTVAALADVGRTPVPGGVAIKLAADRAVMPAQTAADLTVAQAVQQQLFNGKTLS